MLLPRFSLRFTLLAISTCAVFFLVLGQAVHGSPWAIVVAVAVISFALTLLIHGCLYLITAGLIRLVGTQQLPARTSRGGVQTSPDQSSPPPVRDSTAN